MTAQDYAALSVSLLTIGGAFVAMTRWLVKHYLQELKPNGGSSLRDEQTRQGETIMRLESRIDEIYLILLENPTARRGKK